MRIASNGCMLYRHYQYCSVRNIWFLLGGTYVNLDSVLKWVLIAVLYNCISWLAHAQSSKQTLMRIYRCQQQLRKTIKAQAYEYAVVWPGQIVKERRR